MSNTKTGYAPGELAIMPQRLGYGRFDRSWLAMHELIRNQKARVVFHTTELSYEELQRRFQSVLGNGASMAQVRAETDEQKRALLDRLYKLWTTNDVTRKQRLGQLLGNACKAYQWDQFYVEDGKLIDLIEVLVQSSEEASEGTRKK